MKNLTCSLTVLLCFCSFLSNAQYMNSKKSYDANTSDKKILIVPPTEHENVDMERFSTYVEKYWGDVLEYEFVDDQKEAIKRAKENDSLLVGIFYSYTSPINLQASFRPSTVFEINKSDFRIRTYLSDDLTESDFKFGLKHAAYLYKNRDQDLRSLFEQNGPKLKENKVLISVDQMIERTEARREKYLAKIMDSYPYEIEKVSMEEINKAIMEEPDGVLVALKATLEDPSDKSSGTTNYYFIYDPQDGSVVTSSRVTFYPKGLLKNAGFK